MNDNDSVDWTKTRFEGSRREQLQHARALTVRQRLEALNALTEMSDRLQSMPKTRGKSSGHRAPAGVTEHRPRYRAARPINEIVLDGCAPTPLGSYLKALGVLRLISEKYPEARGFWRADRFILKIDVDHLGIGTFFQDDYEPTPIMAPWNGGSGFFEKDNKSALEAIQLSTARRFEPYRQQLAIAEKILAGIRRDASPKGEQKNILLTRIRSELPDTALQWFDAAVLIAGDTARYPPLLGTGGNDGRLDFTNNFMQHLISTLRLNDDEPRPAASAAWLKMALYGASAPGLVNKAIGQFSPGQAGGPNASNGFEASAAMNPWDFVFMIEGALVFAAAAVRRNANEQTSVMSYPFTVRAVAAGAGNLGEGDANGARGEIWMPLWESPASYIEVRALFGEGRIALARRPARDALDFVRAVHHLGGYRGVRGFQRYGLLMRSGKAYLATPLTRVNIGDEAFTSLFDDLDRRDWLDRFRYFARSDNAANRFRMLRKRLEDSLFDMAGRELGTTAVQALLILLGDIQHALAATTLSRESVPPVPRLPERWIAAADDGSSEFRIAKALAGLRGVGEEPLPLRTQIFPVDRKYEQWMTPEAKEEAGIHTGWKGRLSNALRALLARRLWLAGKLSMDDKPLDSVAGATMQDVAAFLLDGRMDARIAALVPAFCLCDIPADIDRSTGDGSVPAAFGMMKLALSPDRVLRSLGHLGESERMPIPAGMLARLAAGNHGNCAVEDAWRRLRTSGLAPVFAQRSLPALNGIDPSRAAAALLIPLRYGVTAALARGLLAEREPAAEGTTIE